MKKKPDMEERSRCIVCKKYPDIPIWIEEFQGVVCLECATGILNYDVEIKEKEEFTKRMHFHHDLPT